MHLEQFKNNINFQLCFGYFMPYNNICFYNNIHLFMGIILSCNYEKFKFIENKIQNIDFREYYIIDKISYDFKNKLYRDPVIKNLSYKNLNIFDYVYKHINIDEIINFVSKINNKNISDLFYYNLFILSTIKNYDDKIIFEKIKNMLDDEKIMYIRFELGEIIFEKKGKINFEYFEKLFKIYFTKNNFQIL